MHKIELYRSLKINQSKEVKRGGKEEENAKYNSQP